MTRIRVSFSLFTLTYSVSRLSNLPSLRRSDYLVTRPLTDWSNVKSQDHIDAAFKAKKFANICNKKEPSILEFDSNAYKNKVKKNREVLTSVIGAVVVCSRQNMALLVKQKVEVILG